MGLWEQFPYSNMGNLNADWLLKTFQDLYNQTVFFTKNNAITYYGLWNITQQYKSNSVVLSNVSNIAYISIKDVPSGIELANTEYWVPIFDLSTLINKILSSPTGVYDPVDTSISLKFSVQPEQICCGDLHKYDESSEKIIIEGR